MLPKDHDVLNLKHIPRNQKILNSSQQAEVDQLLALNAERHALKNPEGKRQADLNLVSAKFDEAVSVAVAPSKEDDEGLEMENSEMTEKESEEEFEFVSRDLPYFKSKIEESQ